LNFATEQEGEMILRNVIRVIVILVVAWLNLLAAASAQDTQSGFFHCANTADNYWKCYPGPWPGASQFAQEAKSTSPTQYNIPFNPAFGDTPVVTTTVEKIYGSGTPCVYVGETTKQYFRIVCGAGQGSVTSDPVDATWIAVGKVPKPGTTKK
jgi:hypothetical protein